MQIYCNKPNSYRCPNHYQTGVHVCVKWFDFDRLQVCIICETNKTANWCFGDQNSIDLTRKKTINRTETAINSSLPERPFDGQLEWWRKRPDSWIEQEEGRCGRLRRRIWREGRLRPHRCRRRPSESLASSTFSWSCKRFLPCWRWGSSLYSCFDAHVPYSEIMRKMIAFLRGGDGFALDSSGGFSDGGLSTPLTTCCSRVVFFFNPSEQSLWSVEL